MYMPSQQYTPLDMVRHKVCGNLNNYYFPLSLIIPVCDSTLNAAYFPPIPNG